MSESKGTQETFFVLDAIVWWLENTRVRMLYFADELGNGNGGGGNNEGAL